MHDKKMNKNLYNTLSQSTNRQKQTVQNKQQ